MRTSHCWRGENWVLSKRKLFGKTDETLKGILQKWPFFVLWKSIWIKECCSVLLVSQGKFPPPPRNSLIHSCILHPKYYLVIINLIIYKIKYPPVFVFVLTKDQLVLHWPLLRKFGSLVGVNATKVALSMQIAVVYRIFLHYPRRCVTAVWARMAPKLGFRVPSPTANGSIFWR